RVGGFLKSECIRIPKSERAAAAIERTGLVSQTVEGLILWEFLPSADALAIGSDGPIGLVGQQNIALRISKGDEQRILVHRDGNIARRHPYFGFFFSYSYRNGGEGLNHSPGKILSECTLRS